MKLKRKSNLLLNADFIQPEVIVAECSEDLSRDEVAKIVWNNNFGEDVYTLYKLFRDDMHIVNVVQFLEKLEKLYVEVEKEKFARQRRMEKSFEEMSVNGKWEKTFEKVSYTPEWNGALTTVYQLINE